MKKEPFIYVITFVVDGCFALVGICIPLLAMRLGATYDDLGAINAIGACAYSLTCFASGRLADRVGYRRIMMAGSLVVALVFLGYLGVTRIWQMFVLGGLSGMAIAGFWPSLQAWLGVGKDRRELRRSIGRFSMAWSLGFLVGPALGGTLYTVDSAWVFGLGGTLVGLVFLAVSFIRVRETVGTGGGPAESATLASSRRFLPIAWVANFAAFFAVGTVRALFPKLATDLGIAPGALGRLMALIGLAQVIGFLLMSRTDRWQFRLSPLVGIQLLAIAGLGTFVFGMSGHVFIAGLLVHGLLIGATFTSSIFYSLHAEGPGGRRTGVHEGIVGSGFLLGPLAGGFMAEHVGARTPYLLAAGVLLGAIVLQVWLRTRWGDRGTRGQGDRGTKCSGNLF